jgi:DNA-binding response OmpR family regulator
MDAKTILIVDDEQTNIDFVVQACKTQSNIKIAYSGEEAFEAIEKFDVDIILLDIVLPGIDGYEVAKKIRSKGIDTPIIFLTSKTDDESIIKGFNVGGNDYVTKPFNAEELKIRVENQIKIKSLKHELLNTISTLNEAQKLAHLGSWELNLKTNILRWSDEVFRIFGLEPQSIDVNYEIFKSFVHKDDVKKLDLAYMNSLNINKIIIWNIEL